MISYKGPTFANSQTFQPAEAKTRSTIGGVCGAMGGTFVGGYLGGMA